MLQIPTTIPQQEDDAAILHPSPSRSSSPPPYQRSVNDQQRNDLEATFDESLDASETQQLLPQPETSSQTQQHHHHHHHVAPTNDGVFNNISAKPDTSKDGSSSSNETPPVYEEAAADTTPPYWHTAVVAPSGDDFVLIEGLPVGNLLQFGWNLCISVSFQFIGFMLTYLFSTTHAARNGSRCGLGATFVQFGFLMKSNGVLQDDEEEDSSDNGQSDVIAYMLMVCGWFIILRAIADYIRVKRLEQIIATQPSAANLV
ncbi:hypothetical protein O0I10_006495 [Lichtheimia ornata]|uniref:Metal homeostatis protein bsd2 n=1 Tax=Lichtheimia ornata TaxID=688661 RepID=A0AAD7XX27_9FUNG|nr:uncharacterized protein O0I10_006495 [Lichtheimia ornata]KAJ8657680.1 hypothetical protein O0I10_006495 [Lichtheimia ornata]